MAVSRKKKFLYIGLGVALALGLAAAFGAGALNRLLEESLDRYVRQKIEVARGGAEPAYSYTYEGLELDVFSERITFTNFRMMPREAHRDAFLKGETDEKALKEVAVSRVTVQGVGLMNFLWDKHIAISDIRIDSVSLDLMVPDGPKGDPEKPKTSGGYSLEGIRLPGIAELSLGRFTLGHFELHRRNATSGDTLMHFVSRGGRLDGLGMKRAEGDETSLFEPEIGGLVLTLDPEKMELPKNLYRMGFEQLQYTFASRDLEIRTVAFSPREDHEAFREQNRYSYEIYDARIKSLKLNDFDMDAFLDQGIVSIGHMGLDSLSLDIFRDKTKPFNTAKRVSLPHQSLAALQFPLHIGSVSVTNGSMKYTEQADPAAQPLVVDFSDLELEVHHVTSLPDSLKGPKPLEISLSAKLDRSIPLAVRLELPYHTHVFRVEGHTEGTSAFRGLNTTVMPAVGLQFTSGRLDGLHFWMTGTPSALKGELTLLYRNLGVELYKNGKTDRKTLSWAANTLLKDSNPNRRGHTVVGLIEAERIPYKGLGNFVWKGVQSGLVNSLNPVGKRRVVKDRQNQKGK